LEIGLMLIALVGLAGWNPGPPPTCRRRLRPFDQGRHTSAEEMSAASAIADRSMQAIGNRSGRSFGSSSWSFQFPRSASHPPLRMESWERWPVRQRIWSAWKAGCPNCPHDPPDWTIPVGGTL